MESFNVNICQKKEGIVWKNRTRISGIAPLLCISNEPPDQLASKCHQCSRIVHAIMDSTGYRILSGDRNGYIHIFDLQKNKFWLLCKLGNCCSALAFTPLKERDILIATSDCKLHLFESASRDHLACLSGHDTCIFRISVDNEGRYALTCSLNSALIWDLLTLTAVRQLAIRENANIIDAFFIVSSEVIITALNDDTIGMWDATSLDHIFDYKMLSNGGQLAVRSTDVSEDGKFLAASGRTNWIIVWEVLVPDKPRVMTVTRNISSVRQIAFLFVGGLSLVNYNHILLVLNHNGILHLYCVDSGESLLDIKLDNERILSIHAAGASGKFVTRTCSGRIYLYDFGEIYRAREKRVYTKSIDRKHDANEAMLGPSSLQESDRLSELTVEKLRGIVREFGTYPEKYRYLIWENLLLLPNNDHAYHTLASKGIHSAYADIASKYPIANKTLLRALQRILSMLAHWSPKLIEVDYLAVLVFPFVKLFHTNLQQCLEIIIVFIFTWCQNWFFYFPSVPYNIFAAVESILAAHDASLLLHFVRHGITAQIYAWPVLQAVFSDVISREEWLELFDHVFSNAPSFLLYAVVAFNVVSRRDLKRCSSISDFQTFYRHRQSSVSIHEVIKAAYRLHSSSDKTLRDTVSAAIGSFTQVAPGSSYPTFDNFPALAIDLHEENRQLQEEIEYFKNRQEILLGDTATDTKNPCTCDSKRNDVPQLSRIRPKSPKASERGQKIENLFERRTPSPTSNRLGTSNQSWQQSDAMNLRGKETINRLHSHVVSDVLRTRRMVARESTAKHRNVADDWNYEML